LDKLFRVIMGNLSLYAATVLIWGSSWYVIKLQLSSVPAEVSIFYRFAIAAIILQAWCRIKQKPMGYGLRAHLLFAQMGFFLFFLNFLLIYYASYTITTGLVSVIFTMLLIFNMINGRIFLGDRISLSMLLGAVIGICGVILVFMPEIQSFNFGDNVLASFALAIGGTLSASCGMVTSAAIQRRNLPVVRSNAWGAVYGALCMLVYIMVRDIPFEFDPSLRYISSLGFLAIFATVLGFGCFLTLIGRIGAGKAAYATVMFPIIALIISTFMEGYVWSLVSTFGVCLALGGNALILVDKQQKA